MITRVFRYQICALALLVALAAPLMAAAPPAAPTPDGRESVTIVSYGSGMLKAANLAPTTLGRAASGSIKVAVKQGAVQLSLAVRDLPEAMSLGDGYLTYVAWAVTAEGRSRNLGEIIVNKGKGRLKTTTQAQVFGVLVTAEPYFAVATPSAVVVLRNTFSGKDEQRASPREVLFDTFAKSIYGKRGAGAQSASAKPPFDLLQARNAVRIAQSFGAQAFAADSLALAEATLGQAETLSKDKKQAKLAGAKAREAVQSAEAARALTVRNIESARVAAVEAAAAARAAVAESEARRAESAAARAQSEAARAQTDAALAQASAADEARRRAAAEENAASAEQARRQAETEKQTLRARLLKQLNLVLETRDSARGLIVNMGDVLFDLEKFTLRPEARERLAKLSGIVLGNPGLMLAVEGHTDATGSDAYNQTLSEERAGAVRGYLVEQQIPAESISAAGYGKARPVAPNDTADGRQKNRRVEIVVSGEIIGTEIEQE